MAVHEATLLLGEKGIVLSGLLVENVSGLRRRLMNGEVRDREKTMRGLKTKDTAILAGYQLFHNYIRPHEALQGKAPSEACGIKVEGKNKWITLIQKASQQTKSNIEMKPT